MAGELILVTGTAVTLEANGSAISNTGIGTADDAMYSPVADGGGYPHGDFVLSLTSASAMTENQVIELIAVEQDVDGTTDTPDATATYRHKRVGFFRVKAATAQTLVCTVWNLPRKAKYMLYNNATGQSIAAAWVLKVVPFTYKPA